MGSPGPSALVKPWQGSRRTLAEDEEMRRADTVVRAAADTPTRREVPLRAPVSPPAAIAFAVRDARGTSAARMVEGTHAGAGARCALVFGSKSAIRIEGMGVLPAHFVVLPTDEGLVVATADERTPAILNGQPMPVAWTNLEIPSRIRVGSAVVDFFEHRESGVVLVDQDVEATVCDSRTRESRLPSSLLSTLPSPLPPAPKNRPRAALLGPSEPPPRGVAAVRARMRRAWTMTPPSSRILLALVAILLVVVVTR